MGPGLWYIRNVTGQDATPRAVEDTGSPIPDTTAKNRPLMPGIRGLYKMPIAKLVCTKCGSDDVIDDYDFVGHLPYKKCRKCGCQKIVESKGCIGLVKTERSSTNDQFANLRKSQDREGDLVNHKLPDEKIKDIEKLTQGGKSIRKIMKITGAAKGTVTSYVEDYWKRTGGERPKPQMGAPRKDVKTDTNYSENYSKEAPQKEIQGIRASDEKTNEIVLDFAKHPEVYQAIAKKAEEQFRTPEMQVMFLLCDLFRVGESS
jgi:hypothetical protein